MRQFIENFVRWTLWVIIYVILVLFGLTLAVAIFQILLELF
jgi:hypothetical protein